MIKKKHVINMPKMKETAYFTYLTKTAGYNDGNILEFDPAFHSCMDIKNGVAFQHNREGWWVIDYKDLCEMHRLASKFRKERT